MPRRSSFTIFPLAAAILVVLGAGHALARGYGDTSSLPYLDDLTDWIGFNDLGSDHRNLFGFVLIGFALVFGYLTNLALNEHGLGRFLNGVVGVVGICLALHMVLPRLGLLHESSEQMRFNLAMIAAGAGASLALVVAAICKIVVTRLLNRGFIRLGRPPRPAPIAAEPQIDPRMAAAMRKKA